MADGADIGQLAVALKPKRARYMWLLLLCVVLANGFVVALSGLSLWESYSQHQQRADATSQNLAILIEEEISGDLERIDVTLLSVVDEVEREFAATGKIDEPALNHFLTRSLSRVPEIFSLRVVGEDGIIRYGAGVLAGSRTDISDQEHFMRQRDNPMAGLVVGKPVVARIDRTLALPLSRRLVHPNGAFAGIVFANMSIEYLNKTLSNVNVGRFGSIALRSADLALVAWHPLLNSKLSEIGSKVLFPQVQERVLAGQNTATVISRHPTDNVERTVSFRKVSGFPFYVLVGLAKQDYLAAWWSEAAKTSSAVVFFCLMTLVSAWWVRHSWRQQFAQQDRLAEQTLRIRRDVIALKQATIKSKMLAQAVEHSPASVIITDAKGNIEYVNPKFTQVTGYTAEETLGKTPRMLQSGLTDLSVYEDLWQTILAGRLWHGELLNRKKNGDLVWENTWISPLLADEGSISHFITVKEDVTERKKVERKMRMLSLAIEHSPVSVIITDRNGAIEYVNPKFTQVSGYSAEEAIGKTPSIVKSDQTPPETHEALWATITSGQVWSGELLNRSRDGTLFWESELIAPILSESGKISHFVAIKEDITNRRLAQQELEANRNFNEQVVLASPMGILTYDSTGQCLTANRNAAHQLGYRVEQLIKQNFKHLESWRASGLLASAKATIASGEVHRNEFHIEARFGKEIWLDAAFARFYADGQPKLLLMLADITSRKQQEERTRQLLVENETILKNALVGIVLIKRRRIISCNRRLEEIFQYEPGELIGEPSERLYDTHENFVATGERAYALLAQGKNFSEELTLRHKDGSLFWGALTGCAINPDYPNNGSIWIYADISERRRAELASSKLLQAVEQSPVSIVITNRDGVIEYVNPVFSRITGYSKEEVVGQTPGMLKTESTSRATHEELWRTILDGGVWRGVLQNRCKNGTLIWEDMSISPILNEAGAITHFVAVKEDVTERKQIEWQLEQHQAHLEDLVVKRTIELSAALEAAKLADRSKDEFLANITHELRTPLSAVIGLSSLARPYATDPVQRAYLDKVNIAGMALSGIIDDLLDLSKIVAGRMVFESRPFSLRQLIGHCRSVISFKVQEKGLELIEQVDEAIPDVLLGDKLRVEQIVLNLLSNAVKFTAAGRVELHVSLPARDEQRVCLNIDVHDTGIGLTEEGIAQLFKPFSQADASITRKYGGTGLGLAICKRLAEMMDGDISVSRRQGSGTTFRVRLWLGLGNACDLPGETEHTPDSAQVHYDDVRVLVVDDQPFNRDVVQGLLAAVGVIPYLAENGQQAIDILSDSTHAFDLVLMDIQMPIMDGLTATRTIRNMERLARLPVIAMTAHTMMHEREISVAAGMDDHIGKPFDEAHFYRVLAKWIPDHKRRIQTELSGRTPAPNGLPQLNGVDTRAGLALLLGDETRYSYWLSDFVAEAPKAMKLIRRAATAGEREAASMAVHALKGRMGLLGMTDLHAGAAVLEAAIDAGEPSAELLLRLEHGVAAMCAEIASQPTLAKLAQPTIEVLPGQLPQGPPPVSVTRLIARLQTGDSDCDLLAEACLVELQNTDWAPRLRQALVHTQNFNYAAASSLLTDGQQEPTTEG